MKNLAIIPARSGSKGLKDKNIALLNGMPLLVYSIRAAQMSGCFEHIFVSTDSMEYAKIAEQYGAEVPFLRSKEASSDTASSWLAVTEALEKYKALGITFDRFMLLQPTSPLRTADDIREAIRLMDEKKANSLVSVCETGFCPLDTFIMPDDCFYDSVYKKELDIRRQDLGKFYRINGAIYLANVDSYFQYNDIYSTKCGIYVMPLNRSCDIDSQIDLDICEFLLSKYRK